MPEFGGAAAARTFEGERLGNDADGEDALVARGLGDDRSGAGTGAAAHASGDEAHVRAVERTLDLVQRLFCGCTPDFGPGSGAKALGNLEAKLDARIGFGGVERLRVGVGDQELDALDVGTDHVGDGIAARAADANDTDPRAKFVDFGPDEINAHEPNPSPAR